MYVNLYGYFLGKRIQLRFIPREVRTEFLGIKFVESEKDMANRVWKIASNYAISFPVWCEE